VKPEPPPVQRVFDVVCDFLVGKDCKAASGSSGADAELGPGLYIADEYVILGYARVSNIHKSIVPRALP